MKVITLISGGDSGGAKTHVHSLLQNLSRTIEVTMVCFLEGPFAQEARELLSEIPQEARVRSSTFFIPQLSMRDEIYVSKSRHPVDYVVLDLRPGYERDLPLLLDYYRKTGWQLAGSVQGYVALFAAPAREAESPPSSPAP